MSKLILEVSIDTGETDPHFAGNKLFAGAKVFENDKSVEVRYGGGGAGNSYTTLSYFLEKKDKEKVVNLLATAENDLHKFHAAMHQIENWDNFSTPLSTYFASAD